MNRVYADYAAATPTDPRVIERVSQVSAENFGNPSSRHMFGRQAEESLMAARSSIASFISANANEIYFTGSGTESNNLAILGIARANKTLGNHIITTAIEHPSVINSCRALEKDGFEITYLPVDEQGQVSVTDFQSAITSQTILATIHLANSEIGVVQDIGALSEIARAKNVIFHTDACQAASLLKLDVGELGVDALTFNGGKLYGPRGIAVLFVRENISIFPLVYGGGQEQSLRSGTENLPGIAGLAMAVEIATQQRDGDAVKVGDLRNSLQADLENLGCIVNCRNANRLPNHLSVIVPTNKTDLVQELDSLGIAVSSGSACSSRSQSDSHVLQAIGLTSTQINTTIRVSLGRGTTTEELAQIQKAVGHLV